MSLSLPLPLTTLLDALLDQGNPLPAKYLHRLSDLDPVDSSQLASIWSKISKVRREALLEDLEEIHLADDLQNFEAVARIGIKDSEPRVRVLSIAILREYELVDLLPTFIDMAEHDPDADVRAASTAALATYIYLGEVDEISSSKLKRVEECLLRLVSNKNTKLVHRRAVEALGFSSRKEVIPLIDKAYSSEDTEWKVTALFAMGRSANLRWKSSVLKMLTHTQPAIRAEAAGAAGELELADARPALLELLEDSDIDVRMAAIWSLSQIGGPGVREALENQLQSTDDNEEMDQLENALDNLEFTDEMREISLLEITEDDEDSELFSEDDYYTDSEDFISGDGKV